MFRVSIMVRVSSGTSWVVNFTLFCYQCPVIYSSPVGFSRVKVWVSIRVRVSHRCSAECRMWNAKLSRGNLQKIKCRTFRKLPVIAFLHSAVEKFRISVDRTKLPFAHSRTLQQICNWCIAPQSILRSLHSVFFVVRFPKNRVVLLQFRLTSNSPTFQVSHHFAGQCHWLQFV